MKFRVIPALLTVLSLALAGCGGASQDSTSLPTGDKASGGGAAVKARTIDEIKKSGSVKIGTFSDKAPFGYVDSSGNYAGYDIELGNRIGEDLGVKVDYVPVEAASRVEFLESGKVDIILANFTITEERAEKVDFANPYMKVSLGVASPSSNPITNPDDLSKRKVVIVKGTTADTYLQKAYPDLHPQKFEQYTEVTSSLVDGRADAWVTDNTEALAWTAKTDGWETSIESFGDPSYIAPAVSKGNTEMLNWINDELEKLGQEQFFHKAYEKTLRPAYGDAVNPDTIVLEGKKE